MIYDQHGREIKNLQAGTQKPTIGRSIFNEKADRGGLDVSRGLTPEKIDKILTAANSGDILEQCKLAMELEEKNHDIKHAMQTRKRAVGGIKWDVEPGGEKAVDIKAAEDFKAAITSAKMGQGTGTFRKLLKNLMNSLIPGFAVSEIVWTSESGFVGFPSIDQRHFKFTETFEPLLITSDNPEGMELHPYKYIINQYSDSGDDPVRGGLIRPLAWLHCFYVINFKDLLRFMERYGMPFTVAKVDKNTWDNELEAVQGLIRNFGPDGGGVFTKSVEVELLQASNGKEEVFFKLLGYLGDAITKVILGQTATSSDGGGMSGDNAQSDVRQDILESDCEMIEDTINSQLVDSWSELNLSESTARPKFVMHCEPPEDKKELAGVKEIQLRAMATAVRSGFLTPTAEDEISMRKYFDLPELPKKAQEAWDVEGGARRPITLQGASQSSVELEEAEKKIDPSSTGKEVSLKTDKKDSAALSADPASRDLDNSPLVGFADYMEQFLDDADGLDNLADQLENNPDALFAEFADDLDQYLEDDINKAIEQAKREVADAKRP